MTLSLTRLVGCSMSPTAPPEKTPNIGGAREKSSSFPCASSYPCSLRALRASVVSSYHSDRYPFVVRRFVGGELAQPPLRSRVGHWPDILVGTKEILGIV